MRIVILVASLLGLSPALAQDAPSVWRDPDGGCTYFKLGDTLDDVREVTRAIEGLSRRLDEVKREFERRGRNQP
jgi:hypothetical protein